jgi:hypothetical protein
MSGSSYSRVPDTPPSLGTAQQHPSQQFAPRAHQWQVTLLPAPPKMDKSLFDRCGNCTRAFGFLSRKVKSSLKNIEVYELRDIARIADLCIVPIVVQRNSNCLNFKESTLEMPEFVIIARNSLKVFIYYFTTSLILVDRMPSQILTTMSVRSLREYIEAYGIAKAMPFVEKSDLITTILDANMTEFNEEVRSSKMIKLIADISTNYTWFSRLV